MKLEKMKWMILGFLILAGCEKNPIDRLTNPMPDGAVPDTSGIYVVYDDELKTGGGVAFTPGGENQTIDMENTDSPQLSKKAIRYEWNGGDVFHSTSPQHLYAGFILIVTPNIADLDAATGKNLSGPGYTRLTFQARGTLSENTVLWVEGPDDASGGITPQKLIINNLSSNWTQYSMNIPAADFVNVKDFLIVTFQFTQPPRTTNLGGGGVVYFDDIRYIQ